MAVLLRDVAALAGVSSTTASLVLTGKDDSIGPDARDRVRSAAAKLGYRPNPIARSLRSNTTRTIGFISNQIVTTPHAGALISGAQEVAEESGYVLLLANTGVGSDSAGRTIETLLDRRIDGAIFATMYHQIVALPPALDSTPVVVLNSQTRHSSTAPWVAPDEAGGARAAVEYLADLGHRRIGYVNTDDDPVAAHERRSSYRAVLQDRDLPHGEHLEATSSSRGGRDSLNEVVDLLSRTDRPTAVFCFNDRIAAGVYVAARRVGLQIPQDLSVVGFDNQVLVSETVDPALTTVQLPHHEMGMWAMRTLLQLIAGSGGADPVRMPCPLVNRDSAAAPGVGVSTGESSERE